MTSEFHVAESVPATKDRMLGFRGLLDVIVRPAAFFEQLKTQPKVLVPLVMMLVAAILFFLLTKDIIYAMQMSSPEAQKRMEGVTLTPQMEGVIKYQIVIFGSITLAVVVLVAAALAFFWGNFVFAGKASFKQLFSVALYGEWIVALGMLIGLPIILAKDALMAPFSLGVMAADQGIDSFAYTALSKIDVFGIWEIIVIGIGLSVIYGVPRKRGYILSLLSVGLLSVLHVIFTGVWKLMS